MNCIINELQQQITRSGKSSVTEVLSYFLSQGTDSRLNTAMSVLRGMIYLLACQQPFLSSHLRKEYAQVTAPVEICLRIVCKDIAIW